MSQRLQEPSNDLQIHPGLESGVDAVGGKETTSETMSGAFPKGALSPKETHSAPSLTS